MDFASITNAAKTGQGEKRLRYCFKVICGALTISHVGGIQQTRLGNKICLILTDQTRRSIA